MDEEEVGRMRKGVGIQITFKWTSPCSVFKKYNHNRYVKDRIKLGDLCGNHFCITLRDVQKRDAGGCPLACTDDIETVIQTSLESLRDHGFINYYGMQRFGTRNVSTHAVGIAMLTGQWELAVDLILMPKGQGG